MKSPLQRIKFNAPVVLSFVGISLIALVLNILTRGVTNALFFSVYPSSFTNPLTYLRMFGHVIGHAN